MTDSAEELGAARSSSTPPSPEKDSSLGRSAGSTREGEKLERPSSPPPPSTPPQDCMNYRGYGVVCLKGEGHEGACGGHLDGCRDGFDCGCPNEIHRPTATPSSPETPALFGEMAKQASLGHKLFCIGIHQYDSGEVEEEWIEWSEAFDRVVALYNRQREEIELMRVALPNASCHRMDEDADIWATVPRDAQGFVRTQDKWDTLAADARELASQLERLTRDFEQAEEGRATNSALYERAMADVERLKAERLTPEEARVAQMLFPYPDAYPELYAKLQSIADAALCWRSLFDTPK